MHQRTLHVITVTLFRVDSCGVCFAKEYTYFVTVDFSKTQQKKGGGGGVNTFF